MRHFSNKFDGPGRQRSLDVEEHEPHIASRSPTEDGNDQNANGEKENEEEEEEEEEDDYMNMTFTDVAPTQPETSLQRRQRLRKEGLQRGHVPSKAELAAQERQKREEGLARSLIPDAATATATAVKKSKGLAMMAKMGFKPGSALGKSSTSGGEARSEPLRIEVKEDRGGIGADAERKRKVQEAADAAGLAKRAKVEELGDYRERMARARESARKEKQVFAAQKIAERMDDERGVEGIEAAGEEGDGEEGERKKKKGGKMSSRPLKSVPVLYRGLVRQREEKERDRRMRYDLEQSSGGLSAKLPTYDDDNMDDDDKMALGRTEKKTVYMPADDLDEEDPELDEFSELDADEKLKRILKYLREKYRYCFWCKCDYPDEEMEGCPGLTEEDHD
ncbi:G patch domain-containing protein 11 [Cytospora mali]|uniref:G patch domain-containing protein 11 n=1 Tax=Cytospora mali TaxID=578113 RepID=A0A194UQS1_CYTMA|nr:G patch domain-containing protein 11 [Valsa mali var. pyri (nom. inval.)]